MPIYEYTCTICSNSFQKLRPMSEVNEPAHCPDCGSDSQRQLSVFMSFSTSPEGQTSAIAGGGGCCGGGSGAGCACASSA